MMASDIDYLREILEGFGQRERLASSYDYQQVEEAMEQLAPGERSGWSFGRTDEELRPTFELIRQGKMPEAETMLANCSTTCSPPRSSEKKAPSESSASMAARLPNFEAVRRYLGPAGRVLRSEKDGWIFTDALLNKEAP